MLILIALAVLSGAPDAGSVPSRKSGISVCVKNFYAESLFDVSLVSVLGPVSERSVIREHSDPVLLVQGRRLRPGEVACFPVASTKGDDVIIQVSGMSLGESRFFELSKTLDRASGRLFIDYGFDLATAQFSVSEPHWR